MSNSDLVEYLTAAIDSLPDLELDLTGVKGILTSEELESWKAIGD